MLSNIPSVAFRVTNFNSTNMSILEEKWDEISNALRLGTRLLADFGFSDRTLTADSVLIPLAYYLYKQFATESFLTLGSRAADREQMRRWITRSLLKSGIWGSGLDGLLLALKPSCKTRRTSSFPVTELETAMATRGKSLAFVDEEIRNLSTMSFSDKRLFSFLSMLYPGMDFKNTFHIDHVFPANAFSKAKLRKRAFPKARLIGFLIATIGCQISNCWRVRSIKRSKTSFQPFGRTHTSLIQGRATLTSNDTCSGSCQADSKVSWDSTISRMERIVDRAKELLGVTTGQDSTAVPFEPGDRNSSVCFHISCDMSGSDPKYLGRSF